MEEIHKNFIKVFLEIFTKFEQIITILLSLIMGTIIIISLVRICSNLHELFVLDFLRPKQITFQDYQEIFGKILTLLISLEFMASIVKVLKSHKILTLIQDVVLITALAIARKLIIFDYEHHDPSNTIVYGGLLVSIGLFYFLVKFQYRTKTHS